MTEYQRAIQSALSIGAPNRAALYTTICGHPGESINGLARLMGQRSPGAISAQIFQLERAGLIRTELRTAHPKPRLCWALELPL